MQVSSQKTPESFVIKITGSIDATTSVLVDAEISKIFKLSLKNLWIDCGEVQSISSAGAGVFIAHLQDLKKHNINLTLFGLQPKLKMVLAVLGLAQILQLQPALNNFTTKPEEVLG
jgi:anti-sigma B factor antagonist